MEFKENIEEVINYLVRNKIKFSIFRMPLTDTITLFLEYNNLALDKFVIQAFDSAQDSLSISGDIVLINQEINLKNIDFNLLAYGNELTKNANDILFFSRNEYENYVKNTVSECRNTKIEKVVCARVKKQFVPNNFNIGAYFMDLIENYASAFVHLYFHNECGLWLGATPELLVQQTKDCFFETVSLAGTKLKSKNRDWTAKEIEEQQIVTDYIQKVLLENRAEILNNPESKTIDAGQIQHLKSEIQFKSNLGINSIAKALHPTPAVCGMPQQSAFDFILKTEGNQRQNYSGFVGVVSKNKASLFVNLRCMQVLEKYFLIYVGAGITKDSIPNKEWQETENKAETLLSLLRFFD